MVHAVSRAIRLRGCCNCQLSLLRAFTGVPSIPLQAPYQLHKGLQHSHKEQARLFSRCSRDATFSNAAAQDKVDVLGPKEEKEDKVNVDSSYNAAVPWYLKIGSPSKPPRPLSQQQSIPELPESPPKILEPLLQQISVDLGLDDLSLLDLRHLDPPPALGANLLMIIGTARSEKHLHVSADRLCRWLRSEYKLRPDADGLLGRNEVKLKMRRKTRRAKLLGSETYNNDVDDGIRTGWVCVNIGTVESASAPQQIQSPKDGFVGFGRQTEGVKIVVQMLVDDKRKELDLERLWSGIAKRSSFESEVMEDVPTTMHEQSGIIPSNPISSTSRISIPAQSSDVFTSISTQLRRFHTVPKKLLQTLEQTSEAPQPTLSLSSTEKAIYTDLSAIRQRTISLFMTGEYDAAFELILANASSVVEFQNESWRMHLLDWLRSSIESMTHENARKELGKGWKDQSSTAYLRCFYGTISRFPSEMESGALIWLHCFARELGHSGYNLAGFSNLFHELRSSGTRISDNMYLSFLRSALHLHGGSPKADHFQPNVTHLQFAIMILHDMYDRTGNIFTEDIFLAIQESLASYPANQSEFLSQSDSHPSAAVTTYNLPTLKVDESNISYRIHSLMSTLQIRVLNDENRIRFMTLYARQRKWVEFWKVWRSVALQGEPRSPVLWALMFKLVAETKHQKGCMSVLREWIPDMDREEPPVMLEGEVLEGVKACLSIADPLVDMAMLYNPEAKGEWINLWRRCLGMV